MAKKATAQSPATKPPTPATATRTPSTSTHKPSSSVSTPATPAKTPTQTSLSARSSPQDIIIHVWNRYLQDTPSRTMLLDVFMAWLVLVGVVQFVYCVLAGNYVRPALPNSLPLKD
jgi:oligosaccharyltransferase complex subunit epsilon